MQWARSRAAAQLWRHSERIWFQGRVELLLEPPQQSPQTPQSRNRDGKFSEHGVKFGAAIARSSACSRNFGVCSRNFGASPRNFAVTLRIFGVNPRDFDADPLDFLVDHRELFAVARTFAASHQKNARMTIVFCASRYIYPPVDVRIPTLRVSATGASAARVHSVPQRLSHKPHQMHRS